jgi:hypothetical protein
LKMTFQQFFYCCVCILYRGDVSTEPLPTNDRGIITELLPSNDKGIFTGSFPINDRGDTQTHTHTHTQQRDLISLPNFFQNKESRLKNFCNRPWRPIGLWDVEAPTFSRQSAHRWRWGCQPHAPAALYPQEDSRYSFLLEAESTPRP